MGVVYAAGAAFDAASPDAIVEVDEVGGGVGPGVGDVRNIPTQRDLGFSFDDLSGSAF